MRLLPEVPKTSTDKKVSRVAAERKGANRWSFRWVMLRYHAAVYRLAQLILRDAREAEDVCQDVFVRYWQRQNEVERPKEWLMKVTRNECLSRLRRSKRLQLGDWENAPGLVDEADPDHHSIQNQRQTALHAAVDRLPEPQRSLVLMFDLQGIDGATCAAVLELSANQVKVYLHRARRRLREQLEHRL